MRTRPAVRRTPWRLVAVLAAALAIPACGGGSSGGSSPLGNSYSKPAAFSLQQTATGIDQLMSAVAVPDGSGFYVAGFTSGAIVTPGTFLPKFVTVLKVLNSGALDPAFNGTGSVTTTLETTGTTDEIDIVLQTQAPHAGKILVGTTQVSGANRNFGVIRLTAAGLMDATFAAAGATPGIASISIDGTDKDVFRSLSVDPTNDEILIHGSIPSAGGTSTQTNTVRTDTDFVVFKLSADGVRDTTFTGGAGQFVLDIFETSATPRQIQVMPDRTILASGYASLFHSSPQPVVYKLTVDGFLDPAFAGNGVFSGAPLQVQTEIYGFAVHGDNIVTGGYGRDAGTINDWVSLKLSWRQLLPVPANPKAGLRDLTWGGGEDGTSMINPSPDPALGSNCRGAAALVAGGKTLLFGSTGTGNTPGQDAVFAVLDATGHLDPAYGAAPQVYPLGALNDQFYGGAANATHLILVGWRGAGAAAGQTAASNDDSFAVIVPVQ